MSMRVVQVNCVIDAEGRDPEALLAAWHTVPAIATAVALAGAEVTVLPANRAAAELRRDGVTYRFIPRAPAAQGFRPGPAAWPPGRGGRP